MALVQLRRLVLDKRYHGKDLRGLASVGSIRSVTNNGYVMLETDDIDRCQAEGLLTERNVMRVDSSKMILFMAARGISSLTEIADKMEVSRQAISMITSGQSVPSLKFRQKWLNVFGTSITDLLQKEEE